MYVDDDSGVVGVGDMLSIDSGLHSLIVSCRRHERGCDDDNSQSLAWLGGSI